MHGRKFLIHPQKKCPFRSYCLPRQRDSFDWLIDWLMYNKLNGHHLRPFSSTKMLSGNLTPNERTIQIKTHKFCLARNFVHITTSQEILMFQTQWLNCHHACRLWAFINNYCYRADGTPDPIGTRDRGFRYYSIGCPGVEFNALNGLGLKVLPRTRNALY